MEANQYSHRYCITAADIDTRYRMTANAVLLYYQDCWARYMACMHMAAFDLVHKGRIWVITEFNAWWEEKDAFWSQDVEVTVWNSEMSNLRLYGDFRMTKPDGTLLSHGYGCWTMLDIEQHRPVMMTELGSEQLRIVPCNERHRKIRIPEDVEMLHEVSHRVNPINLDFNGHVNNRTYLNIAMQTISDDRIGNRRLRSLTIRWLHETFLGDTLQCRLCTTATENAYVHTISKEGTPVAQIYSNLTERTDHSVIDDEALRE